jgi:RNA methyltransferase, TrmH family
MAHSSPITSRQNQRVKDAARLRSGRERRLNKRFIIDGTREITRALASGIRCVEAFFCDDLCTSPDVRQAIVELEQSGAEMLSVSPGVFDKLAFGQRDDGIVVVAETPQRSIQVLKLPAEPLVAVLEGIEKPGNLGAILRTADAAGIDAVIVADGRTDLYNPNTIRASLGTVFRENVCEASAKETRECLRKLGLKVYAARPDAQKLYTEVDLRGGVAIVLGSEAAGLRDAWSTNDVTGVRLPMHGLADSLNVSTTAAVLFYEALGQRT